MGQSGKASQAPIPIKSNDVRTASICAMKSLYDIWGMPYATLVLTENKTGLHVLAKQLGTGVGMIKKHYSKRKATMASDRLV